MQEAGTIALAAGVSTGTAVVAFSAPPTSVQLTVSAPVGGLNLFASLVGTPSMAGFDYALSAEPDSSGYTLNYQANG